ncbi:MAG: M23 family metallopeptidase [Tissierella sp.]|nr:M23 family metallopeptidase [Tissierella sp.]
MKDKFIKTCRENGFLIFLFICVCIVAIGTITVVLQGVDKGTPGNDLVILDNPVDNDSTETVEEVRNSSLDLKTGEIIVDDEFVVAKTNIDTEELDQLDSEKIVDEMDIGEETVDELDDVEEVFYEEDDHEDDDEIEFIDNYVEEPAKVTREMIMPIEGEILTEYAKDKLVYSETLEEWRGHPGIDIKAKLGTAVKAVLDGTVSKVYEDSLWGKTIVIDHGEGLETIYSNLGTLEMVEVGIKVKQGDNISTIGKTAQIELLMEDHLHFEVIKNQKTADPRSIIR